MYSKVHDDFRTNTKTGGIVSIFAVISMVLLFISEFKTYMTIEVIDHVVVDTTLPQHIFIDLDITFPMIQCDDLNISYVEKPNEPLVEMRGNLTMEHRDIFGHNPDPLKADFCGPCYKAKPFIKETMPCCNSCVELRELYRKNGLSEDEPELLRTSNLCTLLQNFFFNTSNDL